MPHVDVCFVAESGDEAAIKVVQKMAQDDFQHHPHEFRNGWQEDGEGISFTIGQILVHGKAIRDSDGFLVRNPDGTLVIKSGKKPVYKDVALCIGGIPRDISFESVACIVVDNDVNSYRITEDSIRVGSRKLCMSSQSLFLAAANITAAVLLYNKGLSQSQPAA